MSEVPYDIDEAVAHICEVDETMAVAIERIGNCELNLLSFEKPCQSVTRSIVYQAISMKAARKIYERLETMLGGDYDYSEVLAFEPEAIKSVGLSATKANAISGVAAAMHAGEIPSVASDYSSMSDQEVIDAFTKVRGIGVWTAQMILMFRLGRPDVMPDGDLGVREGFRIVYDLDDRPTPKSVRTATESWSPYRTIGAWYLWRAVDASGGDW